MTDPVIIAEQHWHTRALVRVRDRHLSGPRWDQRTFAVGDELELVQWGRAGHPIERDTWWDPDVARAIEIPTVHVDVLQVLDDTPPFPPRPGTVYLLHFDRPLRHARHYLGHTDGPLERRLAQHGGPNGAHLMRHVAAAGIGWQLARTWSGDRHRERQLKNQCGHTRHCPICREARRTSTGRTS